MNVEELIAAIVSGKYSTVEEVENAAKELSSTDYDRLMFGLELISLIFKKIQEVPA